MSAKPSIVVAVAVDDGGGPVRRPQTGLARPVGLDDVRHDDQQRVGVGGLRGEQRLGGLAEAGLVGEQEGAVPGLGGGDQLGLVRHQLAGRAGPASEAGSGRSMQRRTAAAVLEGRGTAGRAAPRSPAGGGRACAARRRRSPGRGRGWRAAGRSPTAARPDARWRRTAVGLGGRGLLGRRLDAGRRQHLALEGPGRVGDLGVLGEQLRAARCRGRRSWRGSSRRRRGA